jgi:pyruvate/2-oxoglutarate dehydrogenase complex dihydrolipoamide dehydrogenase (E3) component
VCLLRVERQGTCKVVHFVKNGEKRSVAAHEILYALGRVPNVEGLGLERAGVAFHAETGITVGSDLRSNVPTIFAVGDVIGELQLVHAAIYQGEIAARNAVSGGAERVDYSLWKTHAVFTDPQVAVVGETEKSLRAGGIAFCTASYPFSDHGKAIAVDRTQGFVKISAAPEDGRILGASIVGPDASDLIHEMIVAMSYGATVQQFVKIPHLHPTLAEIWTRPAEEIAVLLEANAARDPV